VKTRVEKRLEMLGLEGTFLLVIHDQSEALVCSDRLAVMHRG
jgi:ABC-type Fe3+/spermidine/putrescine transport system ATPase subunit